MNASDAVGEAIFFLLLLCWLVLFCPVVFSSICFTKAATSDSERGAFRLDAVPFPEKRLT